MLRKCDENYAIACIKPRYPMLMAFTMGAGNAIEIAQASVVEMKLMLA